MRYLFVLMILAATVTGCKKSETETAQAPAAKAPIAVSSSRGNAPLTAEQAASPERILTQSIFTCEGGGIFTAQFKVGGANILIGKNSPIELKQNVTASGFWYSSPEYNLRGKGNAVEWTVLGKKPIHCVTK